MCFTKGKVGRINEAQCPAEKRRNWVIRAVERHKLLPPWSSCRYTHTHTHRARPWGHCLHSHLRKEDRMEIRGRSWIPVSSSACNNARSLVRSFAKSSHSFCSTNGGTKQALLQSSLCIRKSVYSLGADGWSGAFNGVLE